MKIRLAKIYNPQTSSILFMQDYDYKRYQSYPVFRDNFLGYAFFDKVYINVFPLMFTLEELKEFNEDAEEVHG